MADEQDFVLLDATDLQGFNDQGILPLSDEKVSKIQTWLAPTDYKSGEYKKHREAHLVGTGAWILQTEQYKQWHDADRGALWIKAIAGAGKSVLAASLTSKLTAEEEVPVLYFFFRHIISANQKPQSLVRDYLSQVLEYSPLLQRGLYKMIDEDRRSLDSVSLDELWKMLVSALTHLPRVYCVADALDEMDAGNEFFLHDLVTLAQKAPSTLKILLTSRPVPRVEQVLRHPSVLQVLLQPRLVDPDISAYVHHRLSSFQIAEALRLKIHDTMSARADGHFLYARLMMDDLLDPSKNLLSCEDDMLSALNGLPTPMADMYTQMLLDHSRRSGVPQELQLTLLRWVTRAERPLRLLELSSMIDFEQKALGMSKNTKSIVREGCGPLLEILEDETVNPIHHSFTEYLYDQERSHITSEAPRFPVLDNDEAHCGIAITCIKYLASGWHDDWKIDPDPRSHNWYQEKDRILRSIKMKYAFLDYAANHWCQHVRKSKTKAAAVSSEIDSLFAKDPRILPTWLEAIAKAKHPFDDVNPKIFAGWTKLHAAADKGLDDYVENLVNQGQDIECLDIDEHSPLALAAMKGHARVVDILLKQGAKNDEPDNVGLKPLHHAASENYYDVARLLLESGVNPLTHKTKENPGRRCGNAPVTVGHTPLRYVCGNGHIETIKVFIPYLQEGGLMLALYHTLVSSQSKAARAILETPGIDANAEWQGNTLLYLASRNRDVEVMRLLQDMGADVHKLSNEYSGHRGMYFYDGVERRINALQAFARSGADVDVMVMKRGFTMLLDAGLDPNIADHNGATILHSLMSEKRTSVRDKSSFNVEEVLSFLVGRGLSVTKLMHDGSNVLHVSSGVTTTVINMLLAYGVDIDEVRHIDGRTPLMATIQRHDVFMIENLLKCGANANFTDNDGNTPLHTLAQSFMSQMHMDVVKALLAAGADVNARNKDGNTPLHCAYFNGDLIKLFLEYGYDLETKNKKGQTILFHSFSRWSVSGFYKELIDLGASPFIRDNEGNSVLHTLLTDLRDTEPRTSGTIRYFVEKGLDPLTVDNYGNNLWHVIARLGANYHQKEQRSLMHLLMEYKIPPMARNHAGQTPLHIAFSVERNHYEYGSLEFLLEEVGADINVADYDKIRPIHITSSCNANHTYRLLELGADPTACTIEGQTPLMIACRTRHCDIIQILLEHYQKHDQTAMINKTDNNGRSALHYACKSGRPESVALLLKAGAKVNIKDNLGYTPLGVCIEFTDEQALWDKAGIDRGNRRAAYILLTDTNRPTGTYFSVVQDPIRIRETIRLLIAGGADTSFLLGTNQSFHTYSRSGCLLSQAIHQGCSAIVSELLIAQDVLLEGRISDAKESGSAEECFNKVKEENDTIKKYWLSILEQFDNKIRLLDMHYMPSIVTDTIQPGDNNLRMALELLKREDEPAVEQIYKHGARLSELDNGGESAVITMVSWGFTDLMRKVGQDAAIMTTAWTKEKASLNVNCRSERLKPILYTALTRILPNMAMVKLLVSEFKMDISEQFNEDTYNSSRDSPIHLVARPEHWWQTTALEFLLEEGADPETLNSTKETPLIVALRYSHSITYEPLRAKAVEILLRHGANPNAIDEDGLTCLNIAATQPALIKLLLKHGANPSLGLRPFIFDAVVSQDIDALRIVVGSGADINVLATPSPEDALDKADEFEDIYSSPDRSPTDWKQIYSATELSELAYPIHVAASHFFNEPEQKTKAMEIIKLLLEAGGDPFRVYKDGSSVMHVLARSGGMIELFMDHPLLDIESKDAEGRTLLLAACDTLPRYYNASKDIIPLLLKNGASLTAVDNEGRNALHCLLSNLPEDRSCYTTFMQVSKPFLSKLISMITLQGRTPFHYAVAGSHFDLIEVLISHGADPLSHDPLDGSTALHHLATGLPNDEELMTVSELWGESSLADSPEIVPQEDLRLSLDTSSQDSELSTHTKLSVHGLFSSLLSWNGGLSIDARDHTGETPLFRLMTCSLNTAYGRKKSTLFPILKVFETAGANFTARSKSGQSVLHKLATRETPQNRYRYQEDEEDQLEDYRKTFKWLVEKGVDVSWEDEGNRTCLDVAASTGAGWVLEMYKRK